jgi:hypothetical protein
MQDLFLQLFNKNPGDADSQNLLMEITKAYPYFTAAHFFLLKKTGLNQPAYHKIAARTNLQFGNSFLLNYRLNRPEPVLEVKKTEQAEIQSKAEEAYKVKDVVSGEPEMIFEPLFASDYFASQGIKLSEEVQSGDKLGKQLKSFTEWLKSMKKIHDEKALEGNEQIDFTVQKLAEKSNQDTDVLTESMAEAYLQQGKIKKARETLEKLSLLNPAKSAYFAAKLESITRE